MYRSMLRARIDALPQVHNLRDLLAVLENQAYICVSATRNFNEILFRDSCRLVNGSTVILFMSPRCTSFLKIAPHICIIHSMIGGNYNVSLVSCFTPLSFTKFSGSYLINASTHILLVPASNYW